MIKQEIVKGKSRVRIAIVLLLGIFSLTGCSSDASKKGEVNEKNSEVKSVYQEIKDEYDSKFEKIYNNEKLKDISEDINVDYILKKSEEAKELVLSIDNNSDKVSAIEKLVALDDIANHIDKDTTIETLNYIIGRYEINKLREEDHTIKYLYITTLLHKVIKDNEELIIAKDMIYDMNQVCKDTIRQLDLSIIQSNIDQIDNEIDKVKNNIN